MSKRFKGWSGKSIVNYQLLMVNEVAPATKDGKSKTDYSELIAGVLRGAGIECVTEYRFLKDRRFKFDVAIPGYMIAIEYEGGIYSQGRHTRGKGYANDCKKYNLATMHGWKLLRLTCVDLREQGWEHELTSNVLRLCENGRVL